MAIYRNKEELLSTDWQEKINQAAALGDWQSAAQYEQARNEKIASPEYTGSQTATYRYAGYLPEKETAAPAAAAAWRRLLWKPERRHAAQHRRPLRRDRQHARRCDRLRRGDGTPAGAAASCSGGYGYGHGQRR